MRTALHSFQSPKTFDHDPVLGFDEPMNKIIKMIEKRLKKYNHMSNVHK